MLLAAVCITQFTFLCKTSQGHCEGKPEAQEAVSDPATHRVRRLLLVKDYDDKF